MNFSTTRYTRYYASLARLGLPILVGQVGMIIVGFADNIMLGRYSTEALASASFVNGVFNTAIFACIGFSYGITPLVGALFSQRKDIEIGAIMKTGLIINGLFTLLITGLMALIYVNLHHLGQPEELLPLIKPYFALYLAGLIPVSVFQVFSQWSWGINRTRMPMWLILIANLLNIAGNWLLIYGRLGLPELGLVGAAYSTLFARVFCAVAIVVIFFTVKHNRAYVKGFIEKPVKRDIVKTVNTTSWPVAMQSSMEAGSFSVASLMVGWLGALELASYQILIIISTLGFCVYYSLGSAVTVLVSNANGGANRAEMRTISWAGYHIMLLLTVACSAVILLMNRTLIGWFTEDSAVIALTLTMIGPLLLYQVGDATQITFANALRGTAKVMPMLWIAFVCYILIGVPSTYLLGFIFNLGLKGIVLSFSVSLFSAGALFLYFFLHYTKPEKS